MTKKQLNQLTPPEESSKLFAMLVISGDSQVDKEVSFQTGWKQVTMCTHEFDKKTNTRLTTTSVVISSKEKLTRLKALVDLAIKTYDI